MRKCVINFACQGRERYLIGQGRLLVSLCQVGYTGERLVRTSSYPEGCPTHQEVPYAFKYHMFKEAFAQGHELVLWLDASCVIRKPLGPLWSLIKQKGVLLFNNPGANEALFTSKDCLDKLGCSLETAQGLNQCCGGVVGLSRESPMAQDLLARMLELSKDGVSFQGGSNTSPHPKFQSHRHDQSCLTYLARRIGIEYEPFDLIRYSYDSRGLDDAIIEFRGM